MDNQSKWYLYCSWVMRVTVTPVLSTILVIPIFLITLGVGDFTSVGRDFALFSAFGLSIVASLAFMSLQQRSVLNDMWIRLPARWHGAGLWGGIITGFIGLGVFYFLHAGIPLGGPDLSPQRRYLYQWLIQWGTIGYLSGWIGVISGQTWSLRAQRTLAWAWIGIGLLGVGCSSVFLLAGLYGDFLPSSLRYICFLGFGSGYGALTGFLMIRGQQHKA